MNEEIDEAEFYQHDFTTASEWEVFIARIEEVLNQWKNETSHYDETHQSWHTKKEKITFIDTHFELILYKKKDLIIENDNSNLETTKHVMDSWYDFELNIGTEDFPDVHLSKWYGLNQFIVLKPSEKAGITNESKIKVLLSSVNIAVGNTKCNMPLFIKVRENWQNFYLGVYESDNIRTNFEMVHLQKGPQYSHYLAGALDLFKTKVMSPCTIENITVSLKSSYALSNFGQLVWNQHANSKKIYTGIPFEMLFGVNVEPIQTIILCTIFHHLSEYSVLDTESHTDFVPIKAQSWQCSVQMTKDPVCLLADSLNEMYTILSNEATVCNLLDIVAAPTPVPFDKLTEPVVPTMSSLLNRRARNSVTDMPICDGILMTLLHFLFPDAVENPLSPYGKEDNEGAKCESERIYNMGDKFKGFKTCPEDSLVWRLSIILTHCLQNFGGIKAFCHVWYEFVQEMRYRWEKSLPIPGLSPGVPDLRTCLLNQKLQMLNCCLERKIARENHIYASAENSEDSEDEFFDATDGKEEKKYSLWNQPVGRLSKFGNLKLLKTGDPLYIPFTQDPVLKTEDQLEEDTDLLLQLGSDQEASELRARIMAASLLSDMGSFKAANPGAVLEDFIRWYSPRDWIEESEEMDDYGQPKGRLSDRMVLGNNIWVESWNNSRPVPANRQKRLFDDTTEAEKVLLYLGKRPEQIGKKKLLCGELIRRLKTVKNQVYWYISEDRTMGQIAELIMPVVIQAAICRIVKSAEYDVSFYIQEIETQIDNLIKYGEKMSRDIKFNTSTFERFKEELGGLELMLIQICSLKYKFGDDVNIDDIGTYIVYKVIEIGHSYRQVLQLLGKLVLNQEIELKDKENSKIGKRLVSMFNESHKLHARPLINKRNDNEINFPPAFEREFVIRAKCIRPNFNSSESPQFLRIISGQKEYRLVGAFSEDMTFF